MNQLIQGSDTIVSSRTWGRSRAVRVAVATGVALVLGGVGATTTAARDDVSWEPGKIEGTAERVEFLRWEQDRLHSEIQSMLPSHETDVEKAAINRLDGWVQDWLDERIEKLCTDIREAEASAAGC